MADNFLDRCTGYGFEFADKLVLEDGLADGDKNCATKGLPERDNSA